MAASFEWNIVATSLHIFTDFEAARLMIPNNTYNEINVC